MHHHHYYNDVMGWASEMGQLADNCNAAFQSLPRADFPAWDPACLDLSRISKPTPPEDQRVDGPPRPLSHADHVENQQLLFHLPKSKAAELKRLAGPGDGGGSYWISTYDAVSAFSWRVLAKHRARLFKPDPKGTLQWAQTMDMRRRFRDPLPERVQGNIMFAAIADRTPSIQQLTVEEVISEAPLSKLAW